MNYNLKITIPLEWAPGEPGDPHGPRVQAIIDAMEAIGCRFADYGLVSTEAENEWVAGEVVELCFWESE